MLISFPICLIISDYQLIKDLDKLNKVEKVENEFIINFIQLILNSFSTHSQLLEVHTLLLLIQYAISTTSLDKLLM